MSVTLALIDCLRSLGMGEAEILQAVVAVEKAAEDKELRSAYELPARGSERKRAYDREYRRKERENDNRNDVVTTSYDATISYTSPPSETQEVKKEKKERKDIAPRNRGHRLPDDWRPSDDHYAEGEKLGHDRAWVDAQADDMTLWARANEHRPVARKSNWHATFTGWMRRNAKARAGPSGGNVVNLSLRDQQKVKSNEAMEYLREYNRSRANSGAPDRLLSDDQRQRSEGVSGGTDRAFVGLSRLGSGAGS